MKASLGLALASLSLTNQNSMFADNRPAMVYDQADLFRSKNRTGKRKRDLTKVRTKRKMEKSSRRKNR